MQSRVGQQLGQWVPAGVSNGLDWNASSSPRGSARGFPSGAVCIHGFYLKERGFHGPGHTFQQIFIEHLECVRHCYRHLGYKVNKTKIPALMISYFSRDVENKQ